MAELWHIIVFSLLGGLVSLAGGAILLRGENRAELLATYATPFAAGALLSAVFLDLLTKGVASTDAEKVLFAALMGLLAFFIAERLLNWFHHHHQHDTHDPSVSLIILGDTMHNALDGIAIAAGFLISVPTGIVTTIAVASHEIPQEIGDFGLLLKKGVRRKRVLLINVLSALATTVAAVITFALGSAEALPVGVLLGVSAGFLLYIATSDIIPEIHENASKKGLFDWQSVMLLIGVVVVAFLIRVTHQYVEVEHDHGQGQVEVRVAAPDHTQQS